MVGLFYRSTRNCCRSASLPTGSSSYKHPPHGWQGHSIILPDPHKENELCAPQWWCLWWCQEFHQRYLWEEEILLSRAHTRDEAAKASAATPGSPAFLQAGILGAQSAASRAASSPSPSAFSSHTSSRRRRA